MYEGSLVLQVAPLACYFFEGSGFEGTAVAFSAPLWRRHGIAVDILTSMSLFSATAFEVGVGDLGLIVGLQQVLQLRHASSDGHIWYLVGLLEAVEELKLGIILLALELGEVQPVLLVVNHL